MKKRFALTLAIILLLGFAACGTVAERESDMTIDIPAEPMVFYADLTHDDTGEKIVVDLSELENESGWVSVFSSGEKLLWKGGLALFHVGNGGIYLYKGGAAHLLGCVRVHHPQG